MKLFDLLLEAIKALFFVLPLSLFKLGHVSSIVEALDALNSLLLGHARANILFLDILSLDDLYGT